MNKDERKQVSTIGSILILAVAVVIVVAASILGLIGFIIQTW